MRSLTAHYRLLPWLLFALLILAELAFGTSFGQWMLVPLLACVALWQTSGYGLRHNRLPRLARWIRRGMRLGGILWIISFVLMLHHIHNGKTRPLQPAEHLLVLGAGLKGDQPGALLRSRLERAAVILRENPAMQAVVSGGQGRNETTSEADAMRKALIADGIASERILVEDRSRSTTENIAYSRNLLALLHGNQVPPVWILTNEFHLYRASRLAERAGWATSGIAAPTPRWLIPYCNVREYFSISRDWLSELIAKD